MQFLYYRFNLPSSSVISIVFPHSLIAFGHPDGCCYTSPPDDCCYRARSRSAAATEHSDVCQRGVHQYRLSMRHLTSRGSLTRWASPSHIITIVLSFVSDFFGDALLISSDVDSITTQCRQEKGSCQLLRQQLSISTST